VSAPRWRWVGLLSATAIASYLARVNITVAGEQIMREFALTQPQMGRVFSAFVLGYALAMIPGGALADRWGTRRVLVGAAVVWTLVTGAIAGVGLGMGLGVGLGMGLGKPLGELLGLRFLLGVGEAPTFPAAALGISRWIPSAAQGRANGLVLAAIGVGSAIAPPLITWLMTHWGWRVAMIVTAIPAAIVGLLWHAVREPTSTSSPNRPVVAEPLAEPYSEQSPEQYPASLRTRSFSLLTLSYTLQGYVGYIFVFWFYLYLVQERHFALLESAWLASLPWVFSIVSIPAGGWISDRLAAGRLGLVWGRRMVPLVSLVGGGIMLALGAATSNAYLAAGYLACSTAAVLAVEGPFWATMLSVSGRRAGTAGGIMNMGSNIGGFISPALTPVLAAAIGWERALDVAAALAVVAGLLWLGVTPRGEARS